jgi:hypothetical protein
MDRKKKILKYGKNHDENLFEIYGNIKKTLPLGPRALHSYL